MSENLDICLESSGTCMALLQLIVQQCLFVQQPVMAPMQQIEKIKCCSFPLCAARLTMVDNTHIVLLHVINMHIHGNAHVV